MHEGVFLMRKWFPPPSVMDPGESGHVDSCCTPWKRGISPPSFTQHSHLKGDNPLTESILLFAIHFMPELFGGCMQPFLYPLVNPHSQYRLRIFNIWGPVLGARLTVRNKQSLPSYHTKTSNDYNQVLHRGIMSVRSVETIIYKWESHYST